MKQCKKRWLEKLKALVLGLTLCAGKVLAQNLATNPGFETGDTTGWLGFGSPTLAVETTQVHSGTYACLVTNRTASYMGAAQSFTSVLQSGQTYNVSAWVRLVSGASQTVYLTFAKTDGNPTSYAQPATGTATATGWTLISGQYTLNVSGTLNSLTFYAELPNTNAAYYIDDLSVQLVNLAPTNGQCIVDWSNVFQRIDGFGASSAWRGPWTAAQADMFFSTNNGTGTTLDGRTNFPFSGCGLSLLRSHVVAAGTTAATDTPGTYEASIMQMAQARGARVWSTPWTPPGGFKSTNDIYDSLPITNALNGGSYLGSGNNITNLNYASQLANYVAGMKNSYGVNLYALSIQNEPDAGVNTYEACQWTGAQFHDFVTNLNNALVAKGVGTTKIILPESENWASNPGLYTPTLNDPNAAASVSIIANHNYVGDNVTGDTSIPAAQSVSGKAVWETEVSQFGSYDGSITNALYWAGRVHLFMTAAQANAWHYWWLFPFGPDNQGLVDTNGFPAKRMYALGQFARFVRPNYFRINVGNNTGSALVSAYKDSASPNFAIVAINSSSTIVTQAFNLTNVTGIASVTPWVTSGTLSLSNQPPVAISGSTFSYALPALSIVTFVGKSGANTGPTLTPAGSQNINAGVVLVVTNSASDPNVPPLTLNFNLLQGPTNATLIPDGTGTNAVFTWRPLVSQAGSTNTVSLQVTESGSSGLSATNHFSVVVNPLVQPVLGPVSVANGQIGFSIIGTQGPDYTLLTSTDLISWQAIFTTNSPVIPLVLTDTNSTDVARFYRTRIGP